MKKVFLLLLASALMSLAGETKAQICNPYYAYYCGFGYMPVPTGYYVGYIYGGFPHGEGYFYGIDPNIGMVAYRGGFYMGVCNGKGELICQQGYIAGEWAMGTFTRQINISLNQAQNSYRQVQSTYQAHVQPQSNQRLNLADVEIIQIDSDSRMGKQMLGKIK